MAESPVGKHADVASKRISLLEALQSIRGKLGGADLEKHVEAINELRKLGNGNELMEFVPSLIEALRSNVVVHLDINKYVPIGDSPVARSIFTVTKTGIDVKPKVTTVILVSVSTESALTLEHITGQKFGRDVKKWETWMKAR